MNATNGIIYVVKDVVNAPKTELIGPKNGNAIFFYRLKMKEEISDDCDVNRIKCKRRRNELMNEFNRQASKMKENKTRNEIGRKKEEKQLTATNTIIPTKGSLANARI